MDRYGLICRSILESPGITQRELAQILDVSLGTVNSLIKECIHQGLISPSKDGSSLLELLPRGKELLEQYKVDGAVILAAGFGSRFVPLTFEMPKGLLEIFGERMIERQIRQLHEAGIYNITIVVGYLKEKFEYLIDKYQVQLLYNPEYSCKNTLTSVYCARHLLKSRNMYLLSSDNWLRSNMFHKYECGAWYSLCHTDGKTSEWCIQFNKKKVITGVQIGGENSWFMYGPVFLSANFSNLFLSVLEEYYQIPGTEQFYWEHVFQEMVNGTAAKRLKENGSPFVAELSKAERAAVMYANCQPDDQVYEFENLEELRRFDPKYQTHSNNQALELVAKVFQVDESSIRNLRCLKAGMTNKSFLFDIEDKNYICRIPGPGTELLINRYQEGEVYKAIASLGITERIVYFNSDTGYKISRYYENSRTADARNLEDMSQCMKLLRRFHESGITVNHDFDIKERIDFYEKLCRTHESILFEDHKVVLEWMNQLIDKLASMNRPKILCHIDSNADNFLMLENGGLV
ncbi:sugar phosphate nucleotidyltransferase [Clostridium sp. AM58-1XD]|uniref:sugar phosphate nucleotidyltransferase n=1 Tax=Clostridium sp. AM58-1XD TaxID=2292307 RepID=UPI0026791786